jgi:hypothetical protein
MRTSEEQKEGRRKKKKNKNKEEQGERRRQKKEEGRRKKEEEGRRKDTRRTNNDTETDRPLMVMRSVALTMDQMISDVSIEPLQAERGMRGCVRVGERASESE